MGGWEEAARWTFRRPDPSTPDERTFDVSFGDTWTQGPGIYGGLTAAALARAFQAVAPGLPLRSLAVQYCAPLPAGPAVGSVRVDRRGTRSVFVSGRLAGEGGTAVTALGTLAGDRAEDLDHADVACPTPPSPEEGFAMPYLPGVVPVFTQHLELRFVTGLPYAGALLARMAAWARWRPAGTEGSAIEASSGARVDRARLIGLLDAMPPALLARARPGRAASSVTFQLHLTAPVESLRIPPDAWMFAEVWSDTTRSGWSDEEIRLWWPDAPEPAHRLLGVGRQLVAVLR